MKISRFLFLFLLFIIPIKSISQTKSPKREFRGVWIQCVNGQFQGLSPDEMRKILTSQLDELQRIGVNAVIFQVRAECDALYNSKIEPWSRFLTGQQGLAPTPLWDPLEWMVQQCHKRGMELHAWINPYRAKTKGTNLLSSNHISQKSPERVFSYDNQLILNPAIAENRDYICAVVDDIVKRYDIDGLHIDDYFYPYPAAGQEIPDKDQFYTNSNGITDIGEWRRYNVSLFIKQLSETIHRTKPWVKFGISPFGIYRNKKSDPLNGSDTNGLQNYDDLYADILLWINNGWVDYTAPQLYWQIGHSSADYATLLKWWNKYAGGRPLFIGEDVERTVKYSDPDNDNIHQMPAKYKLKEQMRNVKGAVLWYAKAVVDNPGNYATLLKQNYWHYPALQPRMSFIDDKAPKKPSGLKPIWTADGYILFWTAPKAKKWSDEAKQYVVYRFAKNEKIDINDTKHIVKITPNTYIKLPYKNGKEQYTYIVTTLDRLSNESKMAKCKVKL